MRAYQVVEFGPPSALQLKEVDDLVPGEGQIVVDVAAAGINFPDVLVVSGRYQILPPRPFVPGKELTGTVRAIGVGVSGFALGDRVLGQLEHGAFAEQAVVNAADTFRLPDGLGFADATALGLVYQTAYFALLDRAGLRPGETDRRPWCRCNHRSGRRRVLQRRLARAGVVRAAGRHRLCRRRHSLRQSQLSAGEEHQRQRPSMERLSRADAGADGRGTGGYLSALV